MICPNCKQEVTGNFCSNCGMPLEQKESGTDPAKGKRQTENKSSHYTKKQSNQKNQGTKKQATKKKKSQTAGKISRGVTGTVSRGIATAGSVTVGTINTAWKICFNLLPWVCGALMFYITAKLSLGLWSQRHVFGSISRIIQERNINQAAYLILSLGLTAFGILQIFWTVSRKKMPDNGKVRRIDTGRGMLGFLLFFLLALTAHYINPLLPEHPYPLPGLKLVLSVTSTLGRSFALLSFLGVILCFVRKIGR